MNLQNCQIVSKRIQNHAENIFVDTLFEFVYFSQQQIDFFVFPLFNDLIFCNFDASLMFFIHEQLYRFCPQIQAFHI